MIAVAYCRSSFDLPEIFRIVGGYMQVGSDVHIDGDEF